jgi:DNA-binding NarL/FixJ family response regulator
MESVDKSQRVVIVDENPIIRRGLATLIGDRPGLSLCGEAGDSAEALRLVRDRRPDLVITDLALRRGQGIDLIKRITSLNGKTKILVYSMFNEDLYAERALQAGANGYIGKRATPDEIVTAVDRVLTGKIFLSARITDRILSRAVGHAHAVEEDSIGSLSDRELEVFTLIGHGVRTRQIGELLSLSVHTIQTYREKIKQKLGCRSGTEMTRRALQWVLEGGPEGRAVPTGRTGGGSKASPAARIRPPADLPD